MDAFKAELLKTWEELPPVFITSAVSGNGREEIIAFIEEALEDIPWPFNQIKN